MMMFAKMKSAFRRLRHKEDGNATVEFAILFPAFVTILLSGVELGMITLQHSMLERGLDLAVRNVRLGTGTAPQHDEIKAQVCEYAGLLKNCNSTLRLEMVQVDLRNAVTWDTTADCVDTSEAVQPVRTFVNGQENDMMILRACVKIDPIFPTSGLGKQLVVDGAGQAALVAMAAFVQEPN
ncbi:TadE/TadG family type IV pilus assembly protein [Alisedimentitalea sp. MJ-SS2]|uniref:TadE/TadG family type IV pilus assembly protein n=1 Tax=Aliisedimentitalea sp. MJ-SS2 TaxID=3049795 RepID=UPI00290EEBEA|nr:TadE/TadG family type IV pilus assembly protein [Alisedimentitalea sp. MJ-SS2]MDU8929986.1 TadE/TadG family type IV pilus assembly protein [Alisedimentitalea sp. MJ-SS2]